MRLCLAKWFVLLECLGFVVSFCVLDKKRGWWLDCGLRDSYLFRLKDFGGFQANFNLGFGLGDEKGFPNSISQTNTKGKGQYYPPPQTHYGHKRSDEDVSGSGEFPFQFENPNSRGWTVPPRPRTTTAKPSMFSWLSKPKEILKSWVKPEKKKKAVHPSSRTPYQYRRQPYNNQRAPQNQQVDNTARIYRPRPKKTPQRTWITTKRRAPVETTTDTTSSTEWQPVDRSNSQYSSSVPRQNNPYATRSQSYNRRNQPVQQNERQPTLQSPLHRSTNQRRRIQTVQPNYHHRRTQSPSSNQQWRTPPSPQQIPQEPVRVYKPPQQNRRQWSPPPPQQIWRNDQHNFNSIETQNPSFSMLPPPPQSFNSFHHQQEQPVVFHVTTTTTPRPTVGPAMAELLQIPADTAATSDNVPSFAAKLFVIREAPKEFYPPNYSGFVDPHRPKLTVNIPRTKFYCEDQKYLPGIYADAKLGCKMFHLCVPSSVGSTITSYLCPNGTLFDQSILQCNHWYNIDCEASIKDYDANMALALSYRRINAAHLPLIGATNVNTLSLLSQNVGRSFKSKPTATNRVGKAINKDSKSETEDTAISADKNVEEDKPLNKEDISSPIEEETVHSEDVSSSISEDSVNSEKDSIISEEEAAKLELNFDTEGSIDKNASLRTNSEQYKELMQMIVKTQRKFRSVNM